MTGADRRQVVEITGLQDACAAARAAKGDGAVWLLSPPAAAAYWGAGYLPSLLAEVRTAVPGARVRGVLDAAGDAGYAQAAIRAGVDAVIFTGPEDVAARLADIAAQTGVELWTERPAARG